ncbi:glycerophosphoryl diester phosphodiesterase [Actinobaculum suis]|uniref:Glycerophosphoryl diester phosphodiesterase n=2 Tax=Actinobaculum suis TaxID=1657 RepID=A0A1G7EKV6_9ACTO|nr:glycerophosphoryl diester phosphodiesterase [Actinobaculum suis]
MVRGTLTSMPVRFFAHRGLSAQAPENTMASFRAARVAGYEWIETDISITADGELVLFHDDTLDRTTNGSGPLATRTLAELTQLDAGSWFAPEFTGEPIPRLRDLLDFAQEAGMGLNLELKVNPRGLSGNANTVAAAKVLAEIAPYDSSHLLISSFDHDLLRYVHRLAPHLQLGALVEGPWWHSNWRELLESLGGAALHPSNTGLDGAAIAHVREEGFEVNVWTVNDQRRMQELIFWGASGIFSDTALVPHYPHQSTTLGG